MLTKVARFLLLTIIVIVCANFLPELFWMKFEKSISTPYISYSPVVEDFILSRAGKDGMILNDTKENIYTREQYDSLLPFQNYRQLAALNKMPDSIKGTEISLDSVRLNGFTFRIKPAAIKLPDTGLFSLIESKSGRLKLEFPNDFFRITDRIEFVESKTNEINEEKSQLFTNELSAKGFTFPAKLIAGNPTTRKPFDEGYFVLDSKNNLFHIKMEKGKPFCVNTAVPSDLNIVKIFVAESNRREFYGYVVTEKNKIFLLSYDNYKLIELPIQNYDYEKDIFFIQGDWFYRTIAISRYDNIEVFVTDREYKVINHYKENWKGKYESTAGVFADYLFPFSISIGEEFHYVLNLIFRFSDSRAIIVMLISALIAIGIMRYRKESIKQSIPDLLLVLFTGIYGLIAIAVIKNIE